ncbi:MAG TPA: phosphatidic acid phosphatase [Lachnospiraceae bacterium]|nr:phosphatidic acid phosphatase [Lachnospiraceae bacterium]
MKFSWKNDLEFDFRHFRPKSLLEPEYRYLWMLLFWPIFGIFFAAVERLPVTRVYHPVSCAMDALIPFNEIFVIPYYFWFIYLIGTIVFLFFYDVKAFKQMMRFIIFTYGVTMIVYLVYPTCQNLRPAVFARDNILTHIVKALYAFDTNTNVCPSIHVLGSLAAMFPSWHSKRFSGRGRFIMTILCALICVSTLFIKQHSVLDVMWGMILGIVGYLVTIVYYEPIRNWFRLLTGRSEDKMA